MLISITEQCHMGCPHCMDNATPEGNHMSMNTFMDAIQFFNKYGGIECIITGGEPTENPLWIEMLEYALKNANGSTGTNIAHVTLTTNAMRIANNRDIQTYLMLLMQKYDGKLAVQVTHVDGLYPLGVDLSSNFFKCSLVTVCTEIEAMYPLGRARENNLPWQSKCSKCFNIRSAVRTYQSLDMATFLLATKMKFCTPRVNWNGDLKLGESRLCPTVCTIYDDNETIVKNICNFKCRGCDIINKNLPLTHLKAIGEA